MCYIKLLHLLTNSNQPPPTTTAKFQIHKLIIIIQKCIVGNTQRHFSMLKCLLFIFTFFFLKINLAHRNLNTFIEVL